MEEKMEKLVRETSYNMGKMSAKIEKLNTNLTILAGITAYLAYRVLANRKENDAKNVSNLTQI